MIDARTVIVSLLRMVADDPEALALVARIVRPATAVDDSELVPAKATGAHRAVLAAVKAGELPGFRVGRAIAVRRGDLRAWRETARVSPAPTVGAAPGDEFDRALASGRLRAVGGGAPS